MKLKMPLSATFKIKNCSFLYYNNTNNKWRFQITLSTNYNCNYFENSMIILDLNIITIMQQLNADIVHMKKRNLYKN